MKALTHPQMTTNQLHTEDAWCAAVPVTQGGAWALACSPVRSSEASKGAQRSGTRSSAKYSSKQVPMKKQKTESNSNVNATVDNKAAATLPPKAQTEAKNGASQVKETKPQGPEPLTEEERKMLQVHENTLKMFAGGFCSVGNSLKAISKDRLYREKFATFDDYCRDQWGYSKTHAHRLINASNCVEALAAAVSPNGDQRLPANESQVRPLVDKLDSEKWPGAWQKVLKATEGKSITADEVEAVVSKMLGKSTDTTKAKTAAAAKEKKAEAENTLTKIAKLVNKALTTKEPEVEQLKKVLEQIQGMLEVKKAA